MRNLVGSGQVDLELVAQALDDGLIVESAPPQVHHRLVGEREVKNCAY